MILVVQAFDVLGDPVRRRILKALRARDAKAAAKGMDEYLTIVQEGMDAAPAAVPVPAPARRIAVKTTR